MGGMYRGEGLYRREGRGYIDEERGVNRRQGRGTGEGMGI